MLNEACAIHGQTIFKLLNIWKQENIKAIYNKEGDSPT